MAEITKIENFFLLKPFCETFLIRAKLTKLAKLEANLKKADAFQMRICNPSYFKQKDKKIEIVKIAKLEANLKKADAFQMRICNPSYFKQKDKKIEIVKMNF